MLAYALKRVLWTVPILLGVTLVLFLLLHALPGEPARILTGYRTPGEQSIQNLKERLDTEAPLYQQYAGYLSDLARGDLGTSYRTQRPVSSIIAESLPNSLSLASLALILELIIGIAVGARAAVRRSSGYDRLSMVITSALVAMPVFFLGLVLQLLFGVKLRWLPVGGIGDGSINYYLLPSLVLALVAAAYLARVTRSSMIDILSTDYIQAARANGLSRRRVLWVHAFKNALPPILTVAGLHFGFLIGSAVATEVVFDWPGLGHRLFGAVLERDRPLVIGATLVLATIFILINLAVDILNAWLNPKARFEPANDRSPGDVL